MKRMLINATQSDALRVSVVHGLQLIDLDIERPDFQQKKANIYKGRISSIEPSLGAVFVDYGEERHGFLPLKEISREYFLAETDPNDENIDIRSVLRLGQELVVQVEKEERGNKGAALTTFISLAGSYLVLMPNNPRAGGISRRVETDDREHLKEAFTQLQIPDGMGLIIRTAGVGRSKEELEWDLNVLLRYWEAVKQAAIARPGPYLIHQESDVIIRAIRDYLRQDMQEVIIDEPVAYERARHYVNQVRPDFAERLQLYTGFLPLFSRFHIEEQIEAAYQREVQLTSGGSLVIDHSEALVAIDINSSRATKGSNIEETAFNINMEAAQEIARQLRIRDIGGLIVIDFIDMLLPSHQREVENCLRNALRQDRARIQIGRISRFGLLEMSRQRLGSSLRRSSRIACPRCEGQGSIRTVESLAHSIINLLQEQAAKSEQVQLQAILPVDLATFLINEKRSQILQIEQQTQADIMIVPNPQFHSPHFQIRKIKEKNKTAVSYEVIKQQPQQTKTSGQGVKKKAGTNKSSEPAIKEFLGANTNLPPPPRKKSGGIIKRLWEVMTGTEKEAAALTAPVEEKKVVFPTPAAAAPATPPPPSQPTSQQSPRHKKQHRPQGRGGDQSSQRDTRPPRRQGPHRQGRGANVNRNSAPAPEKTQHETPPDQPIKENIHLEPAAVREEPVVAQQPHQPEVTSYSSPLDYPSQLEQVTTKPDQSTQEKLPADEEKNE
ncbi:MAG: Rne/Rng family ribonuclease [Proteobacteria bacterium]|nr:Rne/Rng family ribonuclease [Pseudomonadota bacterium]